MHKLSLYLSPSQYEKLQILLHSKDEEKIEEFINEAVYDGIAKAWIALKAEALSDALEAGDDETVRFSLDGHDYEIWSDGEQAVITEDNKDAIVQLVGGHLHFVLENGKSIRCKDETHERLMAALDAAAMKLKNYTEDELNNCFLKGGSL